MRPLWINAALALAAIWLVVGGIMMWARNARPSPESVAEYMDSNPLEGRAPDDRKKVIDEVADQLNRLGYEERRETRMEKRPDKFLKNLKPDEQAYFLDRTVPDGFKQLLEAINKMTPEKRAKFVARTIDEMRKQREEGGETPPGLDDPNVQKIVTAGLKSFYSEASPETKMDLAPLIEEMQRKLSGW